ncbi:MAG: energy-coupled thiamine transporter ThiT [Oscillospiraceae bacterium]|jgi:thiamine transporter|nr:energy-coupled thiamine transporter ThiT [Oscillospiraceae bacterium]
MENTKRQNLFALTETAILLALAIVLSYVKIYDSPYGGSITLLSMLPICIVSIKNGIGWGAAAGFLNASYQFFLQDGLKNAGFFPRFSGNFFICVLLDYFVPFTIIGLAGLFRKKGYFGWLTGIALVTLARFACHIVSGYVLWGQYAWEIDGVQMPALIYSLVYNAIYMLPEICLTIAGGAILFKAPVINKLIAPKTATVS